MKNTLNKNETSSFFKTSTGYVEMCQAWKKAIAEGKEPTAFELFCYMFLRGRDYTLAFCPITNETKLANGMEPYQALKECIEKLIFKGFPDFFKPFLREEALEEAVAHLPSEIAVSKNTWNKATGLVLSRRIEFPLPASYK